MAQHETIHDLADRAVSDPENISIADRVRLGAWIVDRAEHIAAHKQAVADVTGQTAELNPPPSELVRRMPPPVALRPTPLGEDHADEHPAA